ncbi:MAG: hypothetical protein IKV38_00670 [Clostridia bacterium]|nr:hypothetical protein [Clostridia bacterium]
MDKQSKFAKTLSLLNWICVALLVVLNIFNLIAINGVSNEVSANPDRFPDGFSFEFGLGLAIIVIYMWILHSVVVVFSIPTAIFKNKSSKKGKVVVADVVFSILTAIATLPVIYIGIVYISLVFEILTYGIGVSLIPMAILVVAQVVLAVFNIIHIIVGKKRQNQQVTQEETQNA